MKRQKSFIQLVPADVNAVGVVLVVNVVGVEKDENVGVVVEAGVAAEDVNDEHQFLLSMRSGTMYVGSDPLRMNSCEAVAFI